MMHGEVQNIIQFHPISYKFTFSVIGQNTWNVNMRDRIDVRLKPALGVLPTSCPASHKKFDGISLSAAVDWGVTAASNNA